MTFCFISQTLKYRKYTIEKLMKLPETTLDSTIRDMGGTLTDIEKLSSALSVLKKFNGILRHCYTQNNALLINC